MEKVYVLTASGRIHMAARTETGRLLVDEACNLDDADGVREATPDEVERAAPEAFCRRDFPVDVDGPSLR